MKDKKNKKDKRDDKQASPEEGEGVEGEGSYTAAAEYDADVARFARDEETVHRAAEEARRAIEGDEAEELEAAEREGKSRAKDFDWDEKQRR
jgi:hypothetical protein